MARMMGETRVIFSTDIKAICSCTTGSQQMVFAVHPLGLERVMQNRSWPAFASAFPRLYQKIDLLL